MARPITRRRVVRMAAEFDVGRPATLRRWVFANAAPSVTDIDQLNTLVLVVNEAATASGATGPPAIPVRVELRRGPDGVQCVVPAAGVLPPLSRTEPPTDLLMHNLWLAMRVDDEIDVSVTPYGAGSRITVTLPSHSWS